MKPETTKGLRRLLPRHKRAKRPGDRPEAGPGQRPSTSHATGLESDFDPVEFAEFLDADESPIPIDPGFKEQLRERLWGMVRERELDSQRTEPSAAPKRSDARTRSSDPGRHRP